MATDALLEIYNSRNLYKVLNASTSNEENTLDLQ